MEPTPAPTRALYRRYRPESFGEVIGQDHVTEPLRSALANNRVNHAYLFSGPRGCGKTTSARILARTLNCEKAPVADPCGECQSCADLERGGPGSLDVIEIDAASHGGVDDARDLRERAFFTPVNSRYKVYIIDEAHMVTTQGFNALLKLVEEPPEHLKFIFATTEPEKVIATIRSRTHHYPFRLIAPRVLSDYLSWLCEKEGVAIDASALPLVVRAGAGSVRDSLSVLDQLIGGAGAGGVTYDVATDLLGYTPDNLLDEVIDAFSAGDGAGVFGVVDKVIEGGQDPRRFTEDVLRRLRDLVIVAAVEDASASGLLDVPQDQAERLVAQAARFGKADLVRAADIVASGLTEMRGATTPRLLLELVCARVLLPGADHDTLGFAARMDRLERRVGMGSVEAVSPVDPAAPPAGACLGSVEQGPAPVEPTPAPVETSREAHAVAPSGAPALGLADVRRIWPDLLDRVKAERRYTWMLLSQNAQVIGVEGNIVTIGFKSAGARDSFLGRGNDEILRQVAIEAIGADWVVEAIVDPSAQPGEETPLLTRAAVREPVEEASGSRPSSTGRGSSGQEPTATKNTRDIEDTKDAEASRDDADADAESDADGVAIDPSELLQRELGATVIDEIHHQ
ncbi:MAG: DNA polymerase III subunit gamma and tau [Actinomycetota bacterium]|nr:DNA polymerase III subunit gamma and tau [Actinomycetota bacterium]MDQ6934131.1 DNA polymerase III subunit gamma and tau [Actinomycetota bacterium]